VLELEPGLEPEPEPALVPVLEPVWHKLPEVVPPMLKSNPKSQASVSFLPPKKYSGLPESVIILHFPLLSLFFRNN